MQLLRLEMVMSAWEAFVTMQHAVHQCFGIQIWWPLLVLHLVSMK